MAPIGTGRTGKRGVAIGTDSIGIPCRAAIVAATWRWQIFPWQRPMPARVRLFTTFTSDLLAAADDGVVRRQHVDARSDRMQPAERLAEGGFAGEPCARGLRLPLGLLHRERLEVERGAQR